MTRSIEAAVQTLTRLSRILERAATPLSIADFRALSAICDGEERASRLAQRLTVGKPSISTTIDSLARRGLISRERAEGDLRAVTLTITPEGRASYEHALQRMSERMSEISALTADPDPGISWLGELGDAIEEARSRQAGS